MRTHHRSSSDRPTAHRTSRSVGPPRRTKPWSLCGRFARRSSPRGTTWRRTRKRRRCTVGPPHTGARVHTDIRRDQSIGPRESDRMKRRTDLALHRAEKRSRGTRSQRSNPGMRSRRTHTSHQRSAARGRTTRRYRICIRPARIDWSASRRDRTRSRSSPRPWKRPRARTRPTCHRRRSGCLSGKPHPAQWCTHRSHQRRTGRQRVAGPGLRRGARLRSRSPGCRTPRVHIAHRFGRRFLVSHRRPPRRRARQQRLRSA